MSELKIIKKHWEVGPLESGEIAWLIEQVAEKENLERQLKRSEKERWKTAKSLFDCRKKLKEIKQVVNE